MQRVDRNFVLPRSKRQHGIDVIKSIAMLMVVTLHVMGHGGIFAACEPASHTLESAVFLESAAIIAVDLFVLSSGYLGYGSSHGLARILQLWLQTFFWSLSIGVLFDALDLVPGDQISYLTV